MLCVLVCFVFSPESKVFTLWHVTWKAFDKLVVSWSRLQGGMNSLYCTNSMRSSSSTGTRDFSASAFEAIGCSRVSGVLLALHR